MKKKSNIIVLSVLLCLAGPVQLFAGDSVEAKAPVIETILHEQLAVWPDGEAIVTTLDLPGNFRLSELYHPGEEILYLMEGEGWIHFPDRPDVHLIAGQSARIPARQVHSGSSGAEGLRAVVFRVHVSGEPVRVDVAKTP